MKKMLLPWVKFRCLFIRQNTDGHCICSINKIPNEYYWEVAWSVSGNFKTGFSPSKKIAMEVVDRILVERNYILLKDKKLALMIQDST
jgi:hypothetical protein